jgi:hypothetical protein
MVTIGQETWHHSTSAHIGVQLVVLGDELAELREAGPALLGAVNLGGQLAVLPQYPRLLLPAGLLSHCTVAIQGHPLPRQHNWSNKEKSYLWQKHRIFLVSPVSRAEKVFQSKR